MINSHSITELELSALAKVIATVLLQGHSSDVVCPTTGDLIEYKKKINIKGCNYPGYLAFGYHYVLDPAGSLSRVCIYKENTSRCIGKIFNTKGKGSYYGVTD